MWEDFPRLCLDHEFTEFWIIGCRCVMDWTEGGSSSEVEITVSRGNGSRNSECSGSLYIGCLR